MEDNVKKKKRKEYVYLWWWFSLGFPDSSVGKKSTSMQEILVRFFWVRETRWRRDRLPTPVFWPGEFHGLDSPQGYQELGMIE